MKELSDGSVHLMVTSPPYFNAPFDYPDLFKDYDDFFGLMRDVAIELYRVLVQGRAAEDLLKIWAYSSNLTSSFCFRSIV